MHFGRLKKLGFVIYGDTASPIVPLLVYNPAKISCVPRVDAGSKARTGANAAVTVDSSADA